MDDDDDDDGMSYLDDGVGIWWQTHFRDEQKVLTVYRPTETKDGRMMSAKGGEVTHRRRHEREQQKTNWSKTLLRIVWLFPR